MTLRRAEASDVEDMVRLLKDNDLPSADIGEHLENVLVAWDDGRLIGMVGAEYSGTDALLRSLAVEKASRGQGLGIALSKAILSLMKERGVQRAALLTTTAEGFFRKQGFVAVSKDRIPEIVRSSKEFRLYCPSTAVCMIKELK
ncbi:MAG: hypothetical protein HBSIN02_19860 [Bacteroidia bacterium]|nr:MAG: hypothetical protein HBSIN02_19860 [Bacteroidia bacterium]